MALKQQVQPCMPPMLLEETIPLCRKNGFTMFGGVACENIVKSHFLSKNINVAEPHVDDGVDILVEKPEGWVRCQIKKVVYRICQSRSIYNFNFQGSNRKQMKIDEIDYFYHVLITPYRQLIWETPVSLIPLREDKTFIFGKSSVLDRKYWIRKKPDINYNELLICSKYDPIIFKTYPEFFTT